MKKLTCLPAGMVLPILFVFLLIATSTSVFAQFPANCWDIMQDNSCLRNFTECNIKCARTTDQKKYQACWEPCDKTYTACSDKRTADYKACVNANRKAPDTQETKQLQSSDEVADDTVLTCEEVKDIIIEGGAEDCQNPIVDPAEGGVWCNLPLSRKTVEQYQNLYAPKYTFTPGTCNDVFENNSQDQKADTADSNTQLTKSGARERDGNPFSLFGVNPFETWLNMQILFNIPVYLDNLVTVGEFVTNPTGIKFPEPKISLDPGGKRWDFLPGYIPHESIDLGKSMRVSKGTKLSSGGVDTKSGKKIVNLDEGAIEVIKYPDTVDSEYDGIKTPNGTVLSVQTHYWVSYDKKTNKTTVAVYEGKVEVKTNDGKTQIVSPDGGKPGVVVVFQKLSVPQLVIAGMVVVMLIIGAVWFLKRKRLPKIGNPGRKKR